MSRALGQFTDRLIGLCAVIGCIGVFLQVATILTDVVGRAYGAPLAGARDMTQVLMVFVVFGGMALCGRDGGHIVMDVFERAFPPWLNRAGDVLGALLGCVIFLAIAWTVWEAAKMSQMLRLSTNVIGIPRAPIQWALSAFSVVTAFALLLRAIAIAFPGRDPADRVT